MVKITVTLCTKKREPMFRDALESLVNQTYKDFEYIIVDGYYDTRKDEIIKLINDINPDFSVLHIPDKPSRWRGLRPAISNARNTALIFANGQYIVNHDDVCKMPPNWLEKHIGWLEKGYIVAGTWTGYQFLIGSNTPVEGCYGIEERSKIVHEPKEVTAGWFYGANCSYPLEPVLDINGFEEEFDGEMGQEDMHLAFRLERKGFKTIFDPTCHVGIYMMTHGYDKLIPPIKKVLNDGIEHFSNEFLMQEFLSNNKTILPIGNHFNIKDIREMVSKYNIEQDMDIIYANMKKFINPNEYDWRDEKLIEEKIN